MKEQTLEGVRMWGGEGQSQIPVHQVSDIFQPLFLCCPLLLLPPIPPRIRVFSNESTLRMRWPMYWSFSFSISLWMNIQDRFPLGWTGWISLKSQGLSQFKSINSLVLSLLYGPALTSIHDYWKKPLEKETATHSSILAWEIPWTEEPGSYSPQGHKESDTTQWLHFT